MKVTHFRTSVEMFVCDSIEYFLQIAHSHPTVTDAVVLMKCSILHVALDTP